MRNLQFICVWRASVRIVFREPQKWRGRKNEKEHRPAIHETVLFEKEV
jgi:hypothetical protein